MERRHTEALRAQRRDEAARQQREPVLRALAAVDMDRSLRSKEILHAESHALADAQSRSVDKPRHQLLGTLHTSKHEADLLLKSGGTSND